MAIGITFGLAKDSLRMAVENGVDVLDVRVLTRTNDAILEILTELIPVNGMATYNVTADANSDLLLPKELENAIEVVVLNGVKVNGQSDVTQGFYDLVNPFTYVDPAAAHDNPLVDLFLVPDPVDPSILRRKYHYPGLPAGSVVQVTGAKRYVPIVNDDDTLIVQNVVAIKLMMQAQERRDDGNDPDGGAKYKALCLEMLTAEVKKHQLDPRNTMRRKAGFESDLKTFKRGSMAWMRARLALEVPGAQMMGKNDLTRVMERAEERLMGMGTFKGCLEEFDAAVVAGHVVFPPRVESVLKYSLCGSPGKIRSIFFKYLEDGPGEWDYSCGGRLDDEGDLVMPDGSLRRKYYIYGAPAAAATPATPVTTGGGGGTSTTDTFGTLTADSYVYLGAHARLVALSDGVAIEIKDDSGAWIRQGEWTED